MNMCSKYLGSTEEGMIITTGGNQCCMQNFVNGEITSVAASLTFLLYFNAEVIFLVDKQAILKMK